MSSKAYKLIFALLSVVVFFILLLQGFWIRNFYTQKQDEFNRTVYQSLSRLSSKLQERENIQIIKHSIDLNDKVPAKKKKKVKMIVSSGSSALINSSSDDGQVSEISLNNVFDENNMVTITDSIIKVNDHHKTVIVKKQSGGDKKDEIKKLLNKMMLEISSVDAAFITNTHPDTLKHLIKKELDNNGITMPFEFSLKNINKNNEKVLAQSKSFDPLAKSYKSDLSPDKVFNDHNYLWLQFPGENNFILKGMQGILFLCCLFSLLILASFYYTIRLILKQKKISDVKNDFINNMTHELKTPIATISLVVDGLNNPQVKNDPEKFTNYTRILKEENGKLNNHVERVLQIAMLDKGQLQLNKQAVDLVLLVKEAIDTFKLRSLEKCASVCFVPSLPEVIIQADKFHLQNAIGNLIDNALKYSTQNCEIIIRLEKMQNTIILTVKDNGIGIDASLQEKVFEKFYRVQGGNLHDTKGFGLGLSYVRSIVEAHCGTIELKSEKGKGSEFILKLKTNAN